MADTDETDGSQDPEAPEEEMDSEQVLVFFSKHGEARRALPRNQWTFKEKANFYMDRIFLGFLVVCLILLMGECGYKIWYVSSMKKIVEFALDATVSLFDWLFTQERQEQLAEL